MLTLQWFASSGFARGAPPSGRRGALAMRRLALVALAFAALAAEGCSSMNNGCRGCGGLFSGCGFGRRLFNRGAAADGCDAPLGGAAIETAPVLGAPPGAVIPAPGPATEGEPLNLEPIAPGSTTTPGGTGTGTPTSSNNLKKSLYETYQPTSGGTTTSRPGPRARSRPERVRAEPAVPAEADDPLVNLPPLTPPVDRAESAQSPPAAPVVKDPAPSSGSQASTAPAPSAPAAVPEGDKTVGSTGSLAGGFARFASVDSELSGGSLPTAAGWTFLAEKGYRTVIDLREHSEVKPEEAAAADHAGLMRVALPITPATLDAVHLKHFDELIAQNASRPLFFYDSDGSRAAALWYVHLVATEKRDPSDAARKAEEVGPRDARIWQAAEQLLTSLQPRPAPSTTQTTTPEPSAPPGTAKTEPSKAPSAAPDAAPSSPASAPVSQVEPRDAALPAIVDANTWRPYVALLIAALGVPIAYFGCSALNARALLRASLPAPVRRPKSLPAASGE